jgi:hypothetical protein
MTEGQLYSGFESADEVIGRRETQLQGIRIAMIEVDRITVNDIAERVLSGCDRGAEAFPHPTETQISVKFCHREPPSSSFARYHLVLNHGPEVGANHLVQYEVTWYKKD